MRSSLPPVPGCARRRFLGSRIIEFEPFTNGNAVKRPIENKRVTVCERIRIPQFPSGDDVSALHPLRSSVGTFHKHSGDPSSSFGRRSNHANRKRMFYYARMIPRAVTPLIEHSLAEFAAVAIIGPRAKLERRRWRAP